MASLAPLLGTREDMMLCVVRGLSLPGGRSRVSDPQPCVSSGVVWLLGVGVHAHVAQPSVGDWR